MPDLRFQYDEEFTGANHLTKVDTVNRLFLGGAEPAFRDVDGRNLATPYVVQSAAPGPGADELALFAMEVGGVVRLQYRRQDGSTVRLG